MKINYKSNKLKKICTHYSEAKKKLGLDTAKALVKRINELESIDSVDTLVRSRIGRTHPLHGDRKGQFAMDLAHPQRLIFIKEESTGTIEVVKIISITDYH